MRGLIVPGRGVLAIWHDVEAGGEAAFHEWHLREHLPERLAVPGFLRGRRYEAIEGGPRYYNDYLTVTPEVLASPPYLSRLDDPTPWTRQVVPTFRGTNRTACVIRAAFGCGEGGVLASLRMAPRRGRAALLERLEAALAARIGDPGVVAAQLWEGDSDRSRVRTREAELRQGGTLVADVVATLEGIDVPSVAASARQLAVELEHEAAIESAVYRLTYRLEGDC